MPHRDRSLEPFLTGTLFLLLGLCLARIARSILNASGAGATGQPTSGDVVLSCLSVLVILAADWRVARYWPGVRTLFRAYSAGAWAGAMAPAWLSLCRTDAAGPGAQLLVSLVSLALTLCSAALLEWLARPAPAGALPCESALVSRLESLTSMASALVSRPV
jgi:hypothetical protein